jgi:hypothetical protein
VRARSGRGPFDGLPADVGIPFGPLGRPAAADPEEPFGDQQVDHDGEVDDEREDLQHRNALGQLVHLVGDEDDGRDEGQVFGPPASHPQPDRLSPLHGRVHRGCGTDQVEAGHPDSEQPPEVMHDAVTAVVDWPAEPALQVLEYAGEVGVQGSLMVSEQDHRRGQGGQYQEVEQPVHGDQPQHVAVPQRPAAQRHDDLVPLRRELDGGLAGRGQRDPRIAAQAPVPAQAVRLPGE